MSRPTSNRGGPARPVGLLLLILVAGLPFVGLPLAAQTITVSSTTPNMADQGTVGLVVTIAGQNFANGAKAAFYVTGTTNPGGITVKNVKYKNSKTLEATIDVAADAQTALKFDVQVTINGRTGKGTELFKVNVKVTGGDLTPPGTILDLRAEPQTIGFNAAVLSWTAPADDGFSLSSGPVAKSIVRVRKAWSTETPYCGPYTMGIWVDDTSTGPNADPCHVCATGLVGGTPLSTVQADVYNLAPNTAYWAAIRAVDDSSQGPNWSALPDESHQLYFSTGPFPLTPWTAMVVDACPATNGFCGGYSGPRLGMDRTGNPSMLYVKGGVPTLATWTGSTWQFETTPSVDTGNYAFDLALDPSTGDATIASYVPIAAALRFYRRLESGWQTETVASGSIRGVALRFGGSAGSSEPVATIAYRVAKGSSVSLRVARRLGSSWSSETVASGVDVGALQPFRLAFDADGDPAVAFPQNVSGVTRLAFALRKGSTWTVELLPPDTPGFEPNGLKAADIAFDPRRGDFAVVGRYLRADGSYGQVRYCERNMGSWSCEAEPLGEGELLSGISLAAREDGSLYVGYALLNTVRVLIRDPSSPGWREEYVDWNARIYPFQDLRIGADGQPVMAFASANDATGAGLRAGMSLARRSAQ